MIVNKVDKRVKANTDDVIKYQIVTYCFFNNIKITDSDLEFLKELAKNNGVDLKDLCQQLSDKKIFKTEQSARNAITKAEKKNLIVKDGNRGKKIYLSDELKVQSEGTILLDIKVLSV